VTDHPVAPAPESFAPDVAAWDAGRPEEVAGLLAPVRAPWYVAAGWGIDLFLGYQRRPPANVEIAVPGDWFGEVAAALAGYELFVVGGPPGRTRPLATAGDWLDACHQTWVRERATGRWRLDVFREPPGETTGRWSRVPPESAIRRQPRTALARAVPRATPRPSSPVRDTP
jgi:hypothetical protein